MTKDEFAVIGREALFLMRGTIKDLVREDLKNFDDGREFIFLILPVPPATVDPESPDATDGECGSCGSPNGQKCPSDCDRFLRPSARP